MKKLQAPGWFYQPPAPSTISDHGVEQHGDYLQGKSVAVLVTGSIAAMKTPLIVRSLRRLGAKVTVFASKSALLYVGEDSLSWAANRPVVTALTPKSEHLNGSKPYDCYLVVPASYNTINKIASGIADSVVTTTMASAIGQLHNKKCSILIAPAMHGSMHNPILSKSFTDLHQLGVRFIKPRQEFGKNNLPSKDMIVSSVCRSVSDSPIRDVRILVTGGPTPVKIDDIRRLTNCFSGKLGIAIAKDLYLAGADVILLQSVSGIRPPEWLPHRLYEDYNDYLQTTLTVAASATYGIFSAAVADYGPAHAIDGKIPSGKTSLTIELEPLPKVIEEVKNLAAENTSAVAVPVKIISFKFEADADIYQLRRIAEKKIRDEGHMAVIGNSKVANTQDSKNHHAILFSDDKKRRELKLVPGIKQDLLRGKPGIAAGIRKLIEEEELCEE